MTLTRRTYNFLFLLILLLAFGIASGQSLDQKLSIQAKNKPLGEVLTEISKKGNILFSYSPQLIPADQKVDLKVTNMPVRQVLDKLLTPLGIVYQLAENQVVLRPARSGELPEPKPAETKRKFTLSGYVRDKSSGEVLIGANVYEKGQWQGTTTNAYGFFSLTLAEGSYPVVCSLLGYEASVQNIQLDDNQRVVFELAESSLLIKEVEILSKSDEDNVAKMDAGSVKLSNSTLRQMPGFAGNMDVIKSLNSIPGINSFGDGSTFYYVRGGTSDQNLLMIDEAPIYNPSHLFGFFSALAPDAIKDVKAYKGDFPASYGGRLSSVIDIRARDGNMKRVGFSGNLGPFTTDLTIEGPLKKDKSSFIFSGRHSNLNWLNFSPVQKRTFSIVFYDLNAKLNLRINNNNRIFLTGFLGDDALDALTTGSVNTFGIQWKNAAGTLRWNHIFNNKLFTNTTASFSNYQYFLYISKQLNQYWTSVISNGTIKTDLTWFPNAANTVRAGFELSSHYSNPGNIMTGGASQTLVTEIPQYHSLEYVFYASNEQQIRDRLVLEYGLRLTAWRDLGPTQVYIYDATHKMIYSTTVASGTVYQSFFDPEPRVSASYRLSPKSSLRASYTHTTQHLQMLSNSTSPFTSLEVWAPSGPTILPQKADQVSLGWVRKLGNKGVVLTVETYYKHLVNQVEYKDHANMLYNPLIEGELRFGEIRASGIETLIRKTEGKLTGWIGYSYSKTTRETPEINNGEAYPASYDRPHTLCFNISYRSGRHWEYSANWIYLTGSPVTTPVSFYRYNGYVVPVYGDKNNDRLPDYHRLDVSMTYWFNRPDSRFKHSLVLSVYNLYGRNNPFSINFNKVMNDNGKFLVPSDLDGSYVIVPSMLSVVGVIPSLNYTFRF